MNYKETAERLASCGLTPDTLGAVILELEAGKVSAELAQLEAEAEDDDDDDRDHPSLTAAERNPSMK